VIEAICVMRPNNFNIHWHTFVLESVQYCHGWKRYSTTWWKL